MAERIRALKLTQLPGETVAELDARREAAAGPAIDAKWNAFLNSD